MYYPFNVFEGFVPDTEFFLVVWVKISRVKYRGEFLAQRLISAPCGAPSSSLFDASAWSLVCASSELFCEASTEP